MKVGSSNKKRLRKLIKLARSQGWRVELRSSGHWRFAPPDLARRVVYTGSTPSDSRSYRNLLSDLRQSGLVV